MSTTVIAQPVSLTQRTVVAGNHTFAASLVSVLTGLALLIHGYHPYAEDGGLYVAGIKQLVDPTLYPKSVEFVIEHLRFSLFAPAVAGLVRATRLSLPTVLFLLHLSTIWATLFAVWMLASRCYQGRAARAGAVMLTAAWLTLPVAGTSLILMDPYLTARSFALPCELFALCGTLDILHTSTYRQRLRGAVLCTLSLLLAAAMHPLMAAYALANVLFIVAVRQDSIKERLWRTATLCIGAIALAGVIQQNAPPESSTYVRVAITRYYWFLSQWHWYELLGLVAPLGILAFFAIDSSRNQAAFVHKSSSLQQSSLARMAIGVGGTSLLVALLFAHESAATHLVARLQPLRSFQTIYTIMILMCGATLAEKVLRRFPLRWIATFIFLGSTMYLVQRNTYPNSAHIELHPSAPINRWEQAFIWISRNTPKDALFALDADYISQPYEDAQSFRAIAERSALPDYSKDGGEASITPTLAGTWSLGQRAQARLSFENDTDRLAALRPFHVTWIVLTSTATTTFPCPYENDAVKVCQLP